MLNGVNEVEILYHMFIKSAVTKNKIDLCLPLLFRTIIKTNGFEYEVKGTRCLWSDELVDKKRLQPFVINAYDWK